MLVIRLLVLLQLLSCAYNPRQVVVGQTDEFGKADRNSMDVMIMRERQSLKIALMKLENEEREGLARRTIVIQGKSLLYRMFDSSDDGRYRFLPEIYQIFSLAEKKNIKLVVLCQNKTEQQKLKNIFSELMVPKVRKEFVIAKSLALFPPSFEPLLFISEDFESLWPRNMNSGLDQAKLNWLSHWVELPNKKRQQMSARHWAKYFPSNL